MWLNTWLTTSVNWLQVDLIQNKRPAIFNSFILGATTIAYAVHHIMGVY